MVIRRSLFCGDGIYCLVNCQGKFRFVRVASGMPPRQENQGKEHQNNPEKETKEVTKTSLSGYNLAAAGKEWYSKQASGIQFLELAKVNSAH